MSYDNIILISKCRFGGVIGATAIMLFLPLLVILLSYACGREGGYSPFLRGYQALKAFELSHGLEQIKNWNYGSALWYLGIVCQLAIFSTVTPGEEVEGTLLRDGSRLKYKLNGKTCNFQGKEKLISIHSTCHATIIYPFDSHGSSGARMDHLFMDQNTCWRHCFGLYCIFLHRLSCCVH